MTPVQRIALAMIEDPDHSGVTWDAVKERHGLREDELFDGEEVCSVVYSGWIYSNLASLILAGDDAALAEFIEQVDPLRLVRDDGRFAPADLEAAGL